jgi:hypothetical protein
MKVFVLLVACVASTLAINSGTYFMPLIHVKSMREKMMDAGTYGEYVRHKAVRKAWGVKGNTGGFEPTKDYSDVCQCSLLEFVNSPFFLVVVRCTNRTWHTSTKLQHCIGHRLLESVGTR